MVMPENFWLLIAVLGIFLVGGTVTVGALKVNSPGIFKLKQWLISEKDAQVKLNQMRSEHVIAVFYEVSNEKGLQSPPKLYHMSRLGRLFFDVRAIDEIEGKDAQELTRRLKPWLDNYDAFEKDQARVRNDFKRGDLPVAKIPMCINQAHPHPEFHNKIYYPIIALHSREKRGATRRDYQTVIYLDEGYVHAADEALAHTS